MFKLGKMELIELDDDWTMKIANRLMRKPMFKDLFVRIDRSDKYMVCRVALNSELFGQGNSRL